MHINTMEEKNVTCFNSYKIQAILIVYKGSYFSKHRIFIKKK